MKTHDIDQCRAVITTTQESALLAEQGIPAIALANNAILSEWNQRVEARLGSRLSRQKTPLRDLPCR